MARILILVGLIGAIIAYFVFGLDKLFTLETLKTSRDTLALRVAAEPLLAMMIYFFAYIGMAALSLPGASILTLAGGAFFGIGAGFLLVSFASSIGALLAFLTARYFLRNRIEARFPDRLAVIDRGIERDGAFYLLTLRLVPVLPFFVINLLMGLTKIAAKRFYVVSQIGMIPATLIYVNAGTQLAAISSLRDILTWPLLASFLALGSLPWLARGIIRIVERRRVYSRFTRPARFERNLIVIGAGAAGLVTSYVAAVLRARVTLVEAHKMGGDCLNYGCVPSKALIRAAKSAAEAKKSKAFGVDLALESIRFPALMARIHQVIARIEPHDSVERYTALGVEVAIGHARIIDPWTVEITPPDAPPFRLTTRAIVIAAGASPVIPDLPGIETSGYLTSETLWAAFAGLPALPRRILILGGGPIGCELAQSFSRLGAEVTQLDRGGQLLSREDGDVGAAALQALEKDGVRVLLNHQPLRFFVDGGERILVAESGGLEREIAYDALILAIGRKARLSGYGLEELGISTGKTVEVNDYLETMIPNIYAAGDVSGPFQLTHAAGHQGWHAAVNALFGSFRRFAVDYSAMPATTFLDPEIARIGLSEREAKARGIAFEVTRLGLDDLDRAIADGEDHGFIKVLTASGKDRILGVTIVGAHAGELLAEFGLAMRHGLGLNKVLSTIHAYPTFAEGNKYAAGLWKKAHAPEAILKLLPMLHAIMRGEWKRP